MNQNEWIKQFEPGQWMTVEERVALGMPDERGGHDPEQWPRWFRRFAEGKSKCSYWRTYGENCSDDGKTEWMLLTRNPKTPSGAGGRAYCQAHHENYTPGKPIHLTEGPEWVSVPEMYAEGIEKYGEIPEAWGEHDPTSWLNSCSWAEGGNCSEDGKSRWIRRFQQDRVDGPRSHGNAYCQAHYDGFHGKHRPGHRPVTVKMQHVTQPIEIDPKPCGRCWTIPAANGECLC